MLAQLQRRLPIRAFAKAMLGLFAAIAALALIALLLIRFWLWPALPQWQDDLLAASRAKLADRGLTLEIGSVVADWERWYRPRLTVEKISLQSSEGKNVVQLGQAQATIGLSTFASLWRFVPVFSEIRLQDPKVLGQRDATGAIFVAGFHVNRAPEMKEPADTQVIEWLLRQGRIQVSGGAFAWSDEVRKKSFVIDNVSALARNLGHQHSWSLQASVSKEIGEGFSMQGDFRHPFFEGPAAFDDWSGDLFVQFNRVDLSRLFEFVHLPSDTPLKINSGLGSLKAWAKVDSKQIKELDFDLDLVKGSLQWGASRRPLTFEQLSGKVETELSGNRQRIEVRDLKLQSQQLSDPMQVSTAELRLEQDPSNGEDRLRALSQKIDLAAARWLIEHLPVEPALKDLFARLRPSGHLTGLDVSLVDRPNGPVTLRFESGFDGLALSAGPQSPSFSGLTGRIQGTERSGTLSIDSSKAVLNFPGIFEEPRIGLDKLAAQASWNFGQQPVGAGNADPLKISVSGLSASNSDLSIEASGTYEASTQGPGIVDLKGRVVRASPSQIHRYVPVVAGSTTRKWLRESLKDSSPYRADFILSGPLERFPFADGQSGAFRVNARIDNGRLAPAPGWPIISGIKADVIFDRARFDLMAQQARISGLSGAKIRARIEDIMAPQTLLHVEGVLSGDLQQLLTAANQSPVNRWLGGATESMSGRSDSRLDLSLNLNLSDSSLSSYTGKLSMGKGSLQITEILPVITLASGVLEFTEQGLGSMMIQGQALGGALRIRNQAMTFAPGRSQLQVEGQATGRGLEQWARQSWGLNWKGELSGSTPFSATVDVGRGPTHAAVNTTLKGLSSGLRAPLSKQASEDWPLKVFYRGASRETQLEIDAPRVKGQMRWQADEKTGPVLAAKLDRLWLASRAGLEPPANEEKNDGSLAHQWPRVDLSVEDFRVGSRQWGRAEVQAQPVQATRSWEISRLSLINQDATLTGSGSWSTRALDPRAKVRSRSLLDIEMDVKNGGQMLARAGYPNVVRDTEGKISGQLAWPGSPLDFSGAALSGKLSMSLEKGRFLKAEPGVARLVGVLNLQSLPRRIKLDFSDVFSEGFSYERIRGDLDFAQGNVSTANLRIVGVQATVFLEGTASIRDETQNLRVLVLPEVNAGLASLGYAALVNPAVGLGAFLAQYVLRDPVRKMLAYEYQVTGKWDDPTVTPIAREARAETPSLSPSTQ